MSSQMLFEDRAAMARALIRPGDRVAEIGVLRGDYSEVLLSCEPSELVLVDLWPDERIFREVQERFSSKATLVRADALKSLRQMSTFDCVYLDAQHDYPSVLAQLYAARDALRPGGWLAGHDFCPICDSGVPRAIREFCHTEGLTVDVFADAPLMPVINPVPGMPWVMRYSSYAIKV